MSFDPLLQVRSLGTAHRSRFIVLLILGFSFSGLWGCQMGFESGNRPDSPYLPDSSHDDTSEAYDERPADLALSPELYNSVAKGSSKQSSQNAHFDWPVNEARLTRGFFTKPKKRRGRPHLGIDLAAPKGTQIFAAHDGLVIYVGKEFRGYGRMVMVEGRDGYATLYAHLSKARVRAGSRVRQGDLVGDMGRTGRATGVHLHFEIRRKDGPVDPLQYLPGGAGLFRQAQIHYAPQIGLGLLEEAWQKSQSLSLWPMTSKNTPAEPVN